MTADRIRQAVAPAYLLLCLVLGGSAQGIWANIALQLLAIGIIGWAALHRQALSMPRGARELGLILAAALLLVALQLVPLPPGMWSALGGRAPFADGFEMLGVSPGWLPLSLGPYDGLATIVTVLPALAVMAAMLRFGCGSRWLAMIVMASTAAAVLLGALQVTGEPSAASPWYFYRHSNFGQATGFFANSNHMATMLLMAIPLLAALATTVREWTEDARKRAAAVAMLAGGLAVILVGLALNGSLAGLGLAPIVVVACVLLIVRPQRGWVRNGAMAVGVLGVAVFVLLVATPLNERFVGQDSATSISTRTEIFEKGAQAFQTFSPAGSGLGTFRKVHAMFEDPSEVGRTVVNHAHNDYLELAIELGLPGILLLLVFLAWWCRAAWRAARSQAYDQYAVAGAIASAAVLVHSAVDYPLRTAAVSALFAASIGLMMLSKRKVDSATDLRPTRHIVID